MLACAVVSVVAHSAEVDEKRTSRLEHIGRTLPFPSARNAQVKDAREPHVRAGSAYAAESSRSCSV
jgi:hypothetical protein